MSKKSISILDNNINFLRSCRDNQFDWIISDPPYGIDGNSHRNNMSRSKRTLAKSYHTALWDQDIPDQEFFNQVFRVSKNQIIFGINYFVGKRSLPIGGGRIIWDKVNGKTNFSDCEIAYCSSIYSVRLFRFMWNGMQQGRSMNYGHLMQNVKSNNEKRIHPTQKPVELYKWIFSTFIKSGESILDTHLGSGSSRIAADLCNLDFTGLEIEPTYYNDQENRWREFLNTKNISPKLF